VAVIPPSVIGTVAPILDSYYTHAELNALFMQAGFPGDPPEDNKTQNCIGWMRRANKACDGPLKLLGVLIAEMMDVEPGACLLDRDTIEGDPRDRIQTVLSKEHFSYHRGGYILGTALMGPSKSLGEMLKSDGLTAEEQEYHA
jgi:hypothetical protein